MHFLLVFLPIELQSYQQLLLTNQLTAFSGHTTLCGARPQGIFLSFPHIPMRLFFLQSNLGLGEHCVSSACVFHRLEVSFEADRMRSGSNEYSHSMLCAWGVPFRAPRLMDSEGDDWTAVRTHLPYCHLRSPALMVVNYITHAQLSTAKQANNLQGHLLLSTPNWEVNFIYQTILRPGFRPAHSLAKSQQDVMFVLLE